MKWTRASKRLPEFKKTVFIKDIKDSNCIIMDHGELQKAKDGELYFSGTSRSYPVSHEKYDVCWLDETPTPESQWPTEESEIKIMESIARKHYSEDGPWYYAAMREYAALKRIPKEPTKDEIIKAASKHSVGPEKDWFTTTLVKSHSFITGAEFVIQWLQTSGVREGASREANTSGIKEGTTYEIVNNSDKPMTVTLPQMRRDVDIPFKLLCDAQIITIGDQKKENDSLRKCLGELVAWDKKWPSTKVYSYDESPKVIGQLTAIVTRAKSLLNPDK